MRKSLFFPSFSFSILIFSFLCSFSLKAELAIDSLELPVAGFELEQFIFCSSELILLKNTSTNYEQVFWEIEGNPQITVLSNGDAQFYLLEENAYDVSLIAVNECGSDTLIRENYIGVLKSPTISISATLVESSCTHGETYDLQAVSSDDIVSYDWYPYGCQGVDTLAHCRQRFTFAPTGNEVGVRVTDVNGCTAEAYITIFPPHTQDIIIEAGVNEFIIACEGEDFDESQLNIRCYPPECDLVVGELDTSTPNTHSAVTATGTYNNCTETYTYIVPVAGRPKLELIDSVGCVDNFILIGSPPVSAYEPVVYANGVPIGTAFSNPFYFAPTSTGTYEITAVEQGHNIYCVSPDTLYITVIEQPSIELHYQEKYCREIETHYIIEAEPIEGLPPFTYKWKINDKAWITTDTNVLKRPIFVTTQTENTVLVEMTDANNCNTVEEEANFTIDICNDIEDIFAESFNIYQPNSQQIRVNTNEIPLGTYQLNLYNLSGEMLVEQIFEAENMPLQKEISVENIPAGVYILKIVNQNEGVLNRKIWIGK